MKKPANSKKILQKTIVIPNQANTAPLSMTLQEACQRAEQAMTGNYFSYAEVIFEKIRATAPSFVAAYAALAKIKMKKGEKLAARQLILQALKLEPSNYKLLYDASLLFSVFYENEKSFELIKKAYKLEPSSANILNKYGMALLKRDQKQEAIAALKKAIRLDPQLGETYFNLATCDADAITDEMLENILSRANSAPLKSPHKIMFLYAAAKKLQKQGRLDEEFQCLSDANTIMRQQSTWTWRQELAKWQEFKAKFTSEFIAQLQQSQSKNLGENIKLKPILIATMPRSGSTLVEQIIAAHSTVCAAGESNLLHGPLLEMSQSIWGNNRFWQNINQDSAEKYLQSVVQRIHEVMAEQGLQGNIVTDKSLKNTYIAGLVLCAFPEARVIHCVRNPLDNALSCFQTYLVNGHEYANDLTDTIRVGQIYDQAMAYWKTLFPERIMTVNYEELVENQEAITRKMIAFCGLDWEDNCLNFHENKLVVHTASLTQVRQPMNKNGLARWKKYEKYMGPAIAALNKGIEE